MDTVTIGKGERALTVDLKIPDSPSVVYDVISAGGTRAHCAALGLCWVEQPRPAGRHQTPENLAVWKRARRPARSYAYDVPRYGGEVMDELVRRGFRISEVHAAAVLAYNALAERFLELDGGDEVSDEDEVKEMEGNSEAPPA